MASEDRHRSYAAILWEESAPQDWRSIVRSMHVMCAASPLHDRDVYDEDSEPQEDGTPGHSAGDPKKPHRHLLWIFDGKKSPAQVLKMVQPLGIRWVEPVASSRGYARYLCHLDEPQDVEYPKAIYDIGGIETFCGCSLDLSKPLTGEDLKRVRAEVLSWIRAYSVTEYADVVDYALDREPDWLDYVCKQTVFLTGYLRSVRGSRTGTA